MGFDVQPEYTALEAKPRGCCCRCCNLCCRTTVNRIITILCILFVVFLLGGTLFPWLMRWLVKQGVIGDYVIDSKDAAGYKEWQDTTTSKEPMYYKLTMPNITNPYEVLQGATPKVTLLGPYVYNEYSVKLKVNWTHGGNVVHYWDKHYYVFNPEQSALEGCLNCTEDDLVTNVNIVLNGIYFALPGMFASLGLPGHLGIKTWQSLLKLLMCRAHRFLEPSMDHFPWHSPFLRRSIKDMYFGYKNDPLLAELNKILKLAGQPQQYPHYPGLENNYTDADGEFSVFEFSGPMVQYTGKHDFSRAREFIYWDDMNHTYACPSIPCPPFQRSWDASTIQKNGWVHMWETDAAGSVQAHDGTVYGFGVSKDSELPIFIDTIFRSADLHCVADETTEDLHGIKLQRFRIKHQDMLNAEHWPANAVYDSYGPDGLLNLTAPSGFPLFISKPAFLDGAPELLQGVSGMTQTRDDDTYLDVEPFSGITMRVVKQLQLSGVLEDWGLEQGLHVNISGHDMCDAPGRERNEPEWDGHWRVQGNIKDYTTGNQRFYVPYALVRQTEKIGDSDAHDWTSQGQAMLTAAHLLSIWSNVAAGLCFGAVLGLVVYKCVHRSQEREEVELDAEAPVLPKPPAARLSSSLSSHGSRHILECMEEEQETLVRDQGHP